MADVLFKASLTCSNCDLTEPFGKVDDDGEVDIDRCLYRSRREGWEVTYDDLTGYTIRCAECAEWWKDQR